jgi:hypothetical protein
VHRTGKTPLTFGLGVAIELAADGTVRGVVVEQHRPKPPARRRKPRNDKPATKTGAEMLDTVERDLERSLAALAERKS